MADNVPGPAGSQIMTENTTGVVHVPVSKIRKGAQDVDGGDVTENNPLAISVRDGSTSTGGTGLGAAVKAASTSATATDQALVVSVSPNTNVNVQGPTPSLGPFQQQIVGGNPIAIGAYNQAGVLQSPVVNIVAGGFGGGIGTYSNVLTDLEGYHDDFSGTSLTSNLTGTVTLTNGSTQVTGSGTIFQTEISTADTYIKISTDPDSEFVKLACQPADNTHLVLSSGYIGGTASATATITRWARTIGTGGTIAEGSGAAATSEVALSTGTTSGSLSFIQHGSYAAPVTITFWAKVSQAIANQELLVGIVDNIASPNLQSMVVFSGTSTFQVSLRTSENSNAVETNTATLPVIAGGNGSLTSTTVYNRYRLVCSTDAVELFVNDVALIRNRRHLPSLYGAMPLTLAVHNTGAVGSSSNLIVDSVGVVNHDVVMTASEETTIAAPVAIQGTDVVGNAQVAQVSQSTLVVQPKFEELTYRQCTYSVNTPVAGVAPGTALGTTPPLTLYNPPNTGVMASIRKLLVSYVSGTLGLGYLVWSSNAQSTAPTGGTGVGAVNMYIGGSVGSVQASRGSTVATTQTQVRNTGIIFPPWAGTLLTGPLPQVVDFVDGEINLPPGFCLSVQGIGAAGTSPLVAMSIVYAETPI